MKVLNLLHSGEVGGIEKLCKDIAYVAEYENTFVFLFNEGLIYEEMKKDGADVRSLASYGTQKLSRERLKALKELAKPYDIIVTHHSALAIQMCYVYLKKAYPEKKFILTVHSCFEEKYDYASYTNPIKRIFRKHYIHKALRISDKFIFVSEAGRRSYLTHFHIPEEKTVVVYNGIFLPDVTYCCRKERSENDPYRITFIGRLEEIKGVHNLIRAIPLLKRNGVSCSVYICGDGSYREGLELLSRELHTESEIHFEGVQLDIQKYLCETDVFVYPSVCEEVFGISIVEALSYGVPCVANRVGGIPEILQDNWNGALTETETPESLCEAIERVLKWYQDGKIETIRQNCLQTAKRFTIQETVAGLQRCCESLTGQ